MKYHLHVGVIETDDEATLDEVLAVCSAPLLARPAPNIAVLEREDAKEVLRVLEERGLHPKVSR